MPTPKLTRKQLVGLATAAATVVTILIAHRAANIAEETRLDSRRAQLKSEIAATFDEWKLSAQMMTCYVDTLKLPVNTAGHSPEEIEESRRGFYERVGDISKYTEDQLVVLEKHVGGYRTDLNTNMKRTLSKMRAEATPEIIDRLDKVCHHAASSR